VADDNTLRRGVLSMSHGFGGLPDADNDYLSTGVSTNLLTSTSENLQTINAMPQMSALPVQIKPMQIKPESLRTPTRAAY
jgi:hypothetical protein